METLRRQLKEALEDCDELRDMVDMQEDQHLDYEDLGDVPQPAHQQPGAGQKNTASQH